MITELRTLPRSGREAGCPRTCGYHEGGHSSRLYVESRCTLVLSSSGEKPYACRKCGLSYADKKNMDAHIYREHLKLRPFEVSEGTVGWEGQG